VRQRLPSPIFLSAACVITGFVVASIRRIANINDPVHASAAWSLSGSAAGVVGAAAGFLPMWAIYRHATVRWRDLAVLFGTIGAYLGFEWGSVLETAFAAGVASLITGFLLRGTVQRRGIDGSGPERDLHPSQPG
jgi:hypothetical protein